MRVSKREINFNFFFYFYFLKEPILTWDGNMLRQTAQQLVFFIRFKALCESKKLIYLILSISHVWKRQKRVPSRRYIHPVIYWFFLCNGLKKLCLRKFLNSQCDNFFQSFPCYTYYLPGCCLFISFTSLYLLNIQLEDNYF